MTIDDEQLLHLLLRTTTLVRRDQRPHEGHPHDGGGQGMPPGPPGGPYGAGGPPPGPHPGPGYPPPGPERPQPAPEPRQRRGEPHLAQARVLSMLLMKEGQSQKDLAYLLGIRPQSLTETLAQLEEAGCIERRKNPNDGRVINVYLTEAGRKRAEEAVNNRKQRAEGAFSALDEHDKEELARILTKLSDALER